jgi:hypothetical protein
MWVSIHVVAEECKITEKPLISRSKQRMWLASSDRYNAVLMTTQGL